MALHFASPTRAETIAEVVSFSGEDACGHFSLWPHAERTVTCLRFGAASFRHRDGREEFVAMPGAVLHFVDPDLHLATRRYVRSSSYEEVLHVLEAELRREEESLRELRASMHRLDEELLRRLWQLGRGARP